MVKSQSVRDGTASSGNARRRLCLFCLFLRRSFGFPGFETVGDGERGGMEGVTQDCGSFSWHDLFLSCVVWVKLKLTLTSCVHLTSLRLWKERCFRGSGNSTFYVFASGWVL